MQASNLSWLEAEARYRIAERTAPTRSPHRLLRRPAVSCPPPSIPRPMIGRRLLPLRNWLVQPRPTHQRSAA